MYYNLNDSFSILIKTHTCSPFTPSKNIFYILEIYNNKFVFCLQSCGVFKQKKKINVKLNNGLIF